MLTCFTFILFFNVDFNSLFDGLFNQKKKKRTKKLKQHFVLIECLWSVTFYGVYSYEGSLNACGWFIFLNANSFLVLLLFNVEDWQFFSFSFFYQHMFFEYIWWKNSNELHIKKSQEKQPKTQGWRKAEKNFFWNSWFHSNFNFSLLARQSFFQYQIEPTWVLRSISFH